MSLHVVCPASRHRLCIYCRCFPPSGVADPGTPACCLCCLSRAFQTRRTPPEDDELTEESLAAFVASWDAGELETKEFNLPTKGEGEEGGAEDASE